MLRDQRIQHAAVLAHEPEQLQADGVIIGVGALIVSTQVAGGGGGARRNGAQRVEQLLAVGLADGRRWTGLAKTHRRRVAEAVFCQAPEVHAVFADRRQWLVELSAARDHAFELRFGRRGAVGAPEVVREERHCGRWVCGGFGVLMVSSDWRFVVSVCFAFV